MQTSVHGPDPEAVVFLTIAVPTYNRPGKIRQCVEALLPQLRDGVRMLISDNASEVPVEECLKDLLPNAEGRIQISRNSVNIGMCPNITRLFELSRGEWIWTLGDDDLPDSRAVDTILEAARSAASEVAYFCFGGQSGRAGKRFDFSGLLDELLEERVLTSVICLSSGVYRASSIRPHLQIGHYWNNSYVPYTAMLLKALSEGARMEFHGSNIMNYHYAAQGTSWPYERVMIGLPSLLEIDGLAAPQLARTVGRAIAVYRYRPFVTGSLRRIFGGEARGSFYWVNFFGKMAMHMRGVRRVQAVIFLQLARLKHFFSPTSSGDGTIARS